MKFQKFLTFSTILTLSAHSYATVGGGQKIEVLGYQQKEKKLYVLRLCTRQISQNPYPIRILLS